MDVKLLGGINIDGHLEKNARFRDLSGKVEQAIIELDRVHDRIGFVTEVLNLALDKIGNKAVGRDDVGNLCVADRQYLMQKLATILFGENVWLEVVCKFCDATFDVNINRNQLPYETAGETFPFTDIKLGKNRIRARIPTGVDQSAIQNIPEEQAIKVLLERCISSVNDQQASRSFIDDLNKADLEMIDSAFDAVSPSLCDELLVNCPECKKEQYVKLDHYDMGQMNERNLYDEVHIIASHYHWSEEDILRLARDKRKRYVGMINRSAGIYE